VVFVMEGTGNNFSTSRGRGALFGVGVDTRINARYSITTSLSRSHYAMRGNDVTRCRLDPEGEVVAVGWLRAQQLQDDEVERPLQEGRGFGGHATRAPLETQVKLSPFH
jgi:hypothetical protein